MKREYPIRIYVKGTTAEIVGDGERFVPCDGADCIGFYTGESSDGWRLLGTFQTPEALGAAMIEWAGGSK